MIEVKKKLAPGSRAPARLRLTLPFELRQRRRQRVKLESGEELLISLPRGQVLRNGDLLEAADGRNIQVLAAPEKLVQVECAGNARLERFAYHLGNRHAAVEIGDGFLRIAEDPVLEAMLLDLGAVLTHVEAPFEPESGAYSAQHGPGHGGGAGGSTIHEFAAGAAPQRGGPDQ